MGEPRVKTGENLTLPGRAALSDGMLADEDRLVANLIEKARCSEDEQREIERIAKELVQAARAGRNEAGGVDSFLHEYGLSSREGVLLLCLAEALLRIPDAATADRLIAGTIGSGDWSRHLGQSSSLLVNASTYGLMLTGRVIDWGEEERNTPASIIQRLVGRSGEPVIRQALRQAMRILGGQFVLGQPWNWVNRRSATRLRTVAELFPELIDASLDEDGQLSCSAVEALERQEPFVNQTLAYHALALLARLFQYGSTEYHGAFVNVAGSRVQPLLAEPKT